MSSLSIFGFLCSLLQNLILWSIDYQNENSWARPVLSLVESIPPLYIIYNDEDWGLKASICLSGLFYIEYSVMSFFLNDYFLLWWALCVFLTTVILVILFEDREEQASPLLKYLSFALIFCFIMEIFKHNSQEELIEIFKYPLFIFLVNTFFSYAVLKVLNTEEFQILLKMAILKTVKILVSERGYKKFQDYWGIRHCLNGFENLNKNKAGFMEKNKFYESKLGLDEIKGDRYSWGKNHLSIEIIERIINNTTKLESLRIEVSHYGENMQVDKFTTIMSNESFLILMDCVNLILSGEIDFFVDKNRSTGFYHVISFRDLVESIVRWGDRPIVREFTCKRSKKFFCGTALSLFCQLVLNVIIFVPLAFNNYSQLKDSLVLMWVSTICLVLNFSVNVLIGVKNPGFWWKLKLSFYFCCPFYSFLCGLFEELEFCDEKNPYPHKVILDSELGEGKCLRVLAFNGSLDDYTWVREDYLQLIEKDSSEFKIGKKSFKMEIKRTSVDKQKETCFVSITGDINNAGTYNYYRAKCLISIFEFWSKNSLGVMNSQRSYRGRNYIHLYRINEIMNLFLTEESDIHPNVMMTTDDKKYAGFIEEELKGGEKVYFSNLESSLNLQNNNLACVIYSYLREFFKEKLSLEIIYLTTEIIKNCVPTKKPKECGCTEWKYFLSDLSRILVDLGMKKIYKINLFNGSKAYKSFESRKFFYKDEKIILESSEIFKDSVKNFREVIEEMNSEIEKRGKINYIEVEKATKKDFMGDLTFQNEIRKVRVFCEEERKMDVDPEDERSLKKFLKFFKNGETKHTDLNRRIFSLKRMKSEYEDRIILKKRIMEKIEKNESIKKSISLIKSKIYLGESVDSEWMLNSFKETISEQNITKITMTKEFSIKSMKKFFLDGFSKGEKKGAKSKVENKIMKKDKEVEIISKFNLNKNVATKLGCEIQPVSVMNFLGGKKNPSVKGFDFFEEENSFELMRERGIVKKKAPRVSLKSFYHSKPYINMMMLLLAIWSFKNGFLICKPTKMKNVFPFFKRKEFKFFMKYLMFLFKISLPKTSNVLYLNKNIGENYFEMMKQESKESLVHLISDNTYKAIIKLVEKREINKSSIPQQLIEI